MNHLQLDLFSTPEQLEFLDRLKKLEDTVSKQRRSLFARVNELEKMILELQERDSSVLVDQEKKI